MDKRFLFRGMRIDSGEWGYGVPAVDNRGAMICELIGVNIGVCLDCANPFEYHDVDPATVGRCTGLAAARSYRGESEEARLVFEGDIIAETDFDLVGAVTWSADNLAWMVVNGDNHGFLSDFAGSGNQVAEYISIIGNVHERPGLLGGDHANG